MAGLSEFGGGLLLAVGLLDPAGSLGLIAAMLMAIILVHRGKGLWNDKGGMEVPLIIATVALGLALTGPGAYSLDALLGTGLPKPVALIAGLNLVVLGIGLALFSQARTVHQVPRRQS
jgi:putative oxidoreductase